MYMGTYQNLCSISLMVIAETPESVIQFVLLMLLWLQPHTANCSRIYRTLAYRTPAYSAPIYTVEVKTDGIPFKRHY